MRFPSYYCCIFHQLYSANEQAARFIVFKAGLDLSSPFGPLSQFVLAIPQKVLMSAVEESEKIKRPGFLLSELRKKQ